MMMTLLVIIVILWGIGWCMLHPIVTGKAVCKVVGTIAMGAGFSSIGGYNNLYTDKGYTHFINMVYEKMDNRPCRQHRHMGHCSIQHTTKTKGP